MTIPAALDRAVREVTCAHDRAHMAEWAAYHGADHVGRYWFRTVGRIRARYRQIVAETRISGP